MKSQQNAILLSDGTIFFPSSRKIVSKYTALLSEFSFQKKRKNKS